MRGAKIIAGIFCVAGVCGMGQRISSQSPAAGQAPAKSKRIAILTSTVLDGKGGVLHDKRIKVEGSIIASIEGKAVSEGTPVDYDLRGLTVLPGDAGGCVSIGVECVGDADGGLHNGAKPGRGE
jgi:hypothetical protein